MTKKESTKKDKDRLLGHIRSIPIIEVACKKSNIARATYYRWRNEDPEFLRDSEQAIEDGIELINDMTESQLIGLIKDKKFQAVQFWLRHNHQRFLLKEKEHSLLKPRKEIPLSKEQEKTLKSALVLFT
ncbi:MAG: phBC6A51 family helix-turn-helix protein [bacterium]